MPAPTNRLKADLAAGKLLRGIWLNLGSGLVAEMAGHAGFDWCLVDGEHGPWDPVAIRDQLIALAATPAEAVVRVPVAEDWVLKQALDLGAQTVLVPMVDSAEAARAVVRACRYPPDGVRGLGAMVARAAGFGAVPDYTANANAEICILVQAESRAALAALDEIAAVDGVDGVFIGPADLAADMGHRDDPGHPQVQAAIADAIPRIRAAGKAAGIFLGTPEARGRAVDLGATFVGMGSEAALLSHALRIWQGKAAHDPCRCRCLPREAGGDPRRPAPRHAHRLRRQPGAAAARPPAGPDVRGRGRLRCRRRCDRRNGGAAQPCDHRRYPAGRALPEGRRAGDGPQGRGVSPRTGSARRSPRARSWPTCARGSTGRGSAGRSRLRRPTEAGSSMRWKRLFDGCRAAHDTACKTCPPPAAARARAETSQHRTRGHP